MTDQEKNKMIVEKLEGDWQGWWKYHNLATSDGFFLMWDALHLNKELADDFWNWIFGKASRDYLQQQAVCTNIAAYFWQTYLVPHFSKNKSLINTIRFRDALAEFLKERK